MKTFLFIVLVLGVAHCAHARQDDEIEPILQVLNDDWDPDEFLAKVDNDVKEKNDASTAEEAEPQSDPKVQLTVNGEECLMPFIYNYITRSSCLFGKYCPTAKTAAGKFTSWKKCMKEKPKPKPTPKPPQEKPKPKPTPKPPQVISGNKCIFPFVLGDKLYHECFKYKPTSRLSRCSTAYEVTNKRYTSFRICKRLKGQMIVNTNQVNKQQVRTTDGDLCFFPFDVEGTKGVFNKCFNDKGVDKCPTGYANGKFNELTPCAQQETKDDKLEQRKSSPLIQIIADALIKVIKRHFTE